MRNRTQVGIAEEAFERRPERKHVTRGHEETRFLVRHEIEEPAHGRSDDRAPVCHRLRARDAETLAM